MNKWRSTPQILNVMTISLILMGNSMIRYLSQIEGKSFSASEISLCCGPENLDDQNAEGQLRAKIYRRNLSINLARPESCDLHQPRKITAQKGRSDQFTY
jgi:hypothetical protein